MQARRGSIALAAASALVLLLLAAPAFASSINVTLKTDHLVYYPGQTVRITAVARYASGRALTLARVRSVSLYAPGGALMINRAGMAYRGNGTYAYTFKVPSRGRQGIWTARSEIRDRYGNRTITIRRFRVRDPKPPRPVPSPPPAPSPTSTPAPTPVPPGAGPHATLQWSGYPTTCRGCHASEFNAVHQSLHYQWQSAAPDNTIKTGTLQGKLTNAMNAYCISVLGNWTTCGKCHTGRGAQPVNTSSPTAAQLDNIDCLVCHNEAYALARVRLADGSMGPASGTAQSTLDSYVRNIAKPTRTNCLKCHAYAGGGDAVKRGDISSVQMNTADGNHDVHMATSRGNLACQSCHKFVDHKVTGKGSDLESTDYAAEIKCATTECHPTRVNGGHATAAVNSHIAHVACQTCHIPVYGKVATEMSRDWRVPGIPGDVPSHPSQVKQSNVTPTYKWWNRKTANYLKGDAAAYDPATGTYHMEVLQGGVSGDTTNKIYPFKYKVAYQPMRTAGSILVALDTNQYLNINGNYGTSVQNGLFNMGFGQNDPYTTVKTDTYQLLNHTIADAQSAGGVLKCADCHGSTTRIDLKGQLGYSLKGSSGTVCTQCHGSETWEGYAEGHKVHVTEKKYDCSWCHDFSRPERGLRKP